MLNESLHDRPGAGETRQSRGVELFYEGAFERISSEVFIVEGPTSDGAYTVNLERMSCDCQDFEYHRHVDGFVCKHIIGTGLYAAWLRKSAKVIAPIFRHEEDGVA